MFDLLLNVAERVRDILPVLLPPLLLWTAAALLAEGILRLASRRIHPVWSAATRTVLVVALPFLILVATTIPPLLSALFSQPPDAFYLLQMPMVIPAEATVTAPAPLDTATLLLSGLAIVWMAGVLVGVLRLAGETVALRRLTADLPEAPAALQEIAAETAQAQGIRKTVTVYTTDNQTPPYTFGHRRPRVVVPESLTTDLAAFRLALVHELSHIRRADFLRHLVERVMVVLAWPYPLIHLLHRGLVLDRERLADTDVLTRNPTARRRYSDLLLTFASQPIPRLALGATPGFSQLTNRLETMKRPILSLTRLNRTRTLARVLGSVLLGGFVGLGSLVSFAQDDQPSLPDSVFVMTEDGMHKIPADSAQFYPEPHIDPGPDENGTYSVVQEQPVLIGGIEGLQERVVYPEEARREDVEGRVFLRFIVNEDGSVSDVTVVRSPDPRLSEAATRAVEESRFEPGIQDGKPVKVRFSLPINFALGAPPSAPEPPEAPPAAPPPPPAPPQGFLSPDTTEAEALRQAARALQRQAVELNRMAYELDIEAWQHRSDSLFAFLEQPVLEGFYFSPFKQNLTDDHVWSFFESWNSEDSRKAFDELRESLERNFDAEEFRKLFERQRENNMERLRERLDQFRQKRESD